MMPFLLVATALSLWLRDTAWLAAPGDALPALAGLPLFFFLSGAGRLSATAPPAPRLFLPGVALLLVGLAGDILCVGALGWTILLWSYLSPRLPEAIRPRAAALLPLVLLSFPWLLTEGQPLGWWFRLSGATTTALFFRLIGMSVAHQGTALVIEGMPVSVAPACAGLNLLQALLLVGFLLAERSGSLRTPRDLPRTVLVLLTVAWLANTIRLIVLCAVGLTAGVAAAQAPPLHNGLGLAIFCLLFLAWRLVGGWLDRYREQLRS